MVESEHQDLSIRQQCELLSVARSGLYYAPAITSEEEFRLMGLIDEIYTSAPFYGYRRICAELSKRGLTVNGKRVNRLMREMGLEAIYPRPKTSIASKANHKYPYLLRGVIVGRPGQVWATDITYIRMRKGFLYLVAILDWYSRYVLSWRLSNSLDTDFCLDALESALSRYGKPDIFNSDQGCQFTSEVFTKRLLEAEIRISMDGKGRCHDNIFVERLWRSVKYEEVYLKDYQSGHEAYQSLKAYFDFYNNRRVHQALDYKTPSEIHFGATSLTSELDPFCLGPTLFGRPSLQLQETC